MLLDVNYEPEREYREGRTIPARVEITIPNNDPYSETGLMRLCIGVGQAEQLINDLQAALLAHDNALMEYVNQCEQAVYSNPEWQKLHGIDQEAE